MSAVSKEKSLQVKENEMTTNLKSQIKSRIDSMSTNVRALERKAGLNVGAVNNILSGSSTNPTAETLMALATAFDCTIDELLGRKVKALESQSFNVQSFKDYKWNSDLFISISKELDKQIKSRHLPPIPSDKALLLINEIYLYSLKKNKEVAEESLIEWLLDKSL